MSVAAFLTTECNTSILHRLLEYVVKYEAVKENTAPQSNKSVNTIMILSIKMSVNLFFVS